MKKIAILQSNYIPWKGYFDMIASVDEFILYDDMQFTKNDWRNRNKIKTPSGIEWISVPVGQSKSRRIRDVELPECGWQKKHWKTLECNYRRAPKFEEVSSFLEPLYKKHYSHLSVLNRQLIEAICDYLGITTKISNSWDYTLIDGKTERLVDLCLQAGANEYLSGPAASDYIDAKLFVERDIKLHWFDYKGYQEYPQLWGEFTHEVSILDLLFNCGKDSVNYMRYVKK
ncbi:WbqC family protein [Legionella sp. 227]|uniref:WbqC family protein n=1 Tax=Legionella sp. 227 TaxID=3367288 RepID=UPI00370D2891